MLAKTDARLSREALCAELRSGKHKQAFYEVGNWPDPNAPKCFQGVAFFLLGHSSYRSKGIAGYNWWRANFALSRDDVDKLVNFNDQLVPFPELATKLEECDYHV